MKKSPSARAQSLYSLAKGLEAKKMEIVAAVSTQTGVSSAEAEEEVELSVARLTVWAAYCDKVQGGSLVRPSVTLQYKVRESGDDGILLIFVPSPPPPPSAHATVRHCSLLP